MKKVIITVIVAMAFASAGYAEVKNIVIKDIVGRTHTFSKPAERIIAVRSSLGLVCYMDLCKRVAGVENLEAQKSEWLGSVGRSYALANPYLSELPVTGSRNKPDAERIMAADPDVIFAGTGSRRFLENLQKKTGIPVVAVNNGDLFKERDQFYKSLRIIGRITDSTARAKEIIDYTDKAISDLAVRTIGIPEADKPSVYIGGLNFRTAHGITGTSRDYPPFHLVGANNVADNFATSAKLIKGRFTVDLEALLKADPDIIFICESGIELVKEDFKNSAVKSLNAIKSDNVYGLVPHYYAASPDTVLAEAYYMGKIIYPERFKDIQISEKADELYRFYTGKALYKKMEEIFGGFKKLKQVN